MIEVEVVYRSLGFRWPLRPGDAVEVRDRGEVLLTIAAELVIELLVMHLRNLQLTEHLRTNTVPRKSLAKMLSNAPPDPTPSLRERRRLQRRKRS